MGIYPKQYKNIEMQKNLINDIFIDCKYYEKDKKDGSFKFYSINEEKMFENMFKIFLPFMFEKYRYTIQRDDRFIEERFKLKNKNYKVLPFKQISNGNGDYKFLPLEFRDFHHQKDLFKEIFQQYDYHNKIEESLQIPWTVFHVNVTDIFLYQMALRGYSLKHKKKKD